MRVATSASKSLLSISDQVKWADTDVEDVKKFMI